MIRVKVLRLCNPREPTFTVMLFFQGSGTYLKIHIKKQASSCPTFDLKYALFIIYWLDLI